MCERWDWYLNVPFWKAGGRKSLSLWSLQHSAGPAGLENQRPKLRPQPFLVQKYKSSKAAIWLHHIDLIRVRWRKWTWTNLNDATALLIRPPAGHGAPDFLPLLKLEHLVSLQHSRQMQRVIDVLRVLVHGHHFSQELLASRSRRILKNVSKPRWNNE